MKKLFKVIGLVLLVFSLSVGVGQISASAAEKCYSDDIKCASASMTYGKQQYVASKSVYYRGLATYPSS
ncbi:hypothetical protein ACTHAL_000897 [Priestia flexa]|uniref:Uncharacterized protein n=1 Tax=Priestia veravalensis TaxID=1414648 RepID=A0A0V8JGS0_9BACI|nr:MULTISPECIES: hypothetical protein [Priestia]KSU86177.1 hypothetical protein AS180_20125 [Priestia veravalensis]SCC56754.1 hypothetical protein GA0061087_109612 [Priestia flexa]